MTIVEFTQLLTPIGIIVTAWVSWDNKRILRRQDRVIAHVDDQVQKIEVATNSMKDALVKATAQAARAAGVVEGVAQEKARQS